MKQRKDRNARVHWTLVTQFGLSLVTSMLLCVFLSLWLKKRFLLGEWIILVGVAVGLIAMGLNFYRFYRLYMPKEDTDIPLQRNHHD